MHEYETKFVDCKVISYFYIKFLFVNIIVKYSRIKLGKPKHNYEDCAYEGNIMLTFNIFQSREYST
jgi:hypothetical protein